jgi:hypothetical protein
MCCLLGCSLVLVQGVVFFFPDKKSLGTSTIDVFLWYLFLLFYSIDRQTVTSRQLVKKAKLQKKMSVVVIVDTIDFME